MARFFKNLILAGMISCFAISFAYGYFQHFYFEGECRNYGEQEPYHKNRTEVENTGEVAKCEVFKDEDILCNCWIYEA